MGGVGGVGGVDGVAGRTIAARCHDAVLKLDIAIHVGIPTVFLRSIFKGSNRTRFQNHREPKKLFLEHESQ